MRSTLLTLTAAALLAACASNPGERIAATPATSATATATATATSEPAPGPKAIPTTAARVTPAKSAEKAPPLGSKCDDPETCGSRGRVAIRTYETHGRAAPAACELQRLRARGEERMGPGSGDELRACVVGDRLVIQSECVTCRLTSVTVVEVLVEEATGPQLAYARGFARLEGELTTAAAWRDAIREGAAP